jgi:serine/threonine protein phosphatase PrpC
MTVRTLRLPRPLGWRSGVATDRGRVRPVNQDACLARPQLGLWAVADGMGGHHDGARASREIVEALAALPRPRLLGAGARRVYRALAKVNSQLLQAAQGAGEDIIGSTVTVLLTVGRHGALIWAGDSRAYRLRDDRLEQLTVDHSRVQAMVDAAIVPAEEAESHPLANVLLRAVGSEARLVLDQRVLEVRPGDRFLLCSDGLYRELMGDEIASILRTALPADAASRLVASARERGGKDNISAVVVECTRASIGSDEPAEAVAKQGAPAV